MRAAWFLLAASCVLTVTLLQVGSPAEPLFGAAQVKEVRLDGEDWDDLRHMVMPRQYFDQSQSVQSRTAAAPRSKAASAPMPAAIASSGVPPPFQRP
ncbi:MAG TPA: hypothetical protein VL285_18265 [Bryobacteraceae bacterium]|jgi:hypothetical protein|nr:hypothetical protein [Bryobacteraceae bacterium]